MVRPKLKMQPRNVSLGVAKQLGLDRPGEERQARAGAHSALACVMRRGTSERRCASAKGGQGGKKGGKKQQGWPKNQTKDNGQLLRS